MEGLGHNDLGAVALAGFGEAVAAEGPVGFEIVAHGEGFLEAAVAGRKGIGLWDHPTGTGDAVQVPFAEVAGAITLLLSDLGQSEFLPAQGHAGPEDAHAIGVAAGQDASAGRGAALLSVEAVQAQPGGGKCVELRSFDLSQSVKADIAPALIVGHAEDDIGARTVGGRGRDYAGGGSEPQQAEDAEE